MRRSAPGRVAYRRTVQDSSASALVQCVLYPDAQSRAIYFPPEFSHIATCQRFGSPIHHLFITVITVAHGDTTDLTYSEINERVVCIT